MKLTAFIVLSVCLQVSARNGLAQQTITLSERNAALETVLQKIHDQIGYEYFFKAEDAKNVSVTIDVKNTPVNEVLPLFFQGKDFTYEIVNKIIVVKKKDYISGANLEEMHSLIGSEIIGIVRSENGIPLAGATILIKRLSKSGVTDGEGKFSLKNVPNGTYEVVITYVGYEKFTTIIQVDNNEIKITAELKASINNLDETVIKGYYNTTKRLNTGDVSTVKGEQIARQPIANVLSALEGTVPGLYISQNTGVPGGNFTVRLRGQNSIASGNDPLYIVDGVPFTSTSMATVGTTINTLALGGGTSPLNYLNPSDIASVDVLKDADATAIYGSRGANGVILITTKKGKAGKTKFDFNVYKGAGSVAHQMKLLNTRQYLQMRREAFKNDGATPTPSTIDLFVWDTTRNTNWQKALLGGTASVTDVQGNFSGGNDNTQFLFGGGYRQEGTVFPGSAVNKKSSVHLTLSHTTNDQKFNANIAVSYILDDNSLPANDLTNLALNLAPDAPALYDSTGKLDWSNSTWTNPLSYTLQTYSAKTKNLLTNALLSYNLFSGFQIRSSFGYTDVALNETQIYPKSSFKPNNTALAYSLFGNSNLSTWIIEPQAEYKKQISKGTLNVLVGTSFQENNFTATSLTANGYSSDALLGNIQSATSIATGSNTITDYKYNSLFGRIGFNWDQKYLLNLTARRDGSSRFGPDKQFGNFGAIGAAWIFSNENIFRNTFPWLNYGKLRGSYGTSGNDQIGDYQYLSTYSSNGNSYLGGILYPNGLTNGDFRWELNRKLEGGIELGFLQDRVLLTASYFQNRSSNQLVGYSLAPTTGFQSIQYNLPATVQNSGTEFVINTSNIKSKNFSWNTSINFTIPRNKLISYYNLAGSNYATQYVIGKSLFIAKAYNYQGVDPQTGLYIFEDVNKDGKISSPEDRQTIKPISQNYYGGIENDFRYKGFELNILIQFVKQTGRNYLYSYHAPGIGNATFGNQPDIVMSRWQKQGDMTNVEQFTQIAGSAYVAYSNSNSYGSNTISDASFIRVRNVQISYSIPGAWKSKLKMDNCRIYFQGQNLITITHYLGLSPETQSFNQLPPLRILAGGIQVIF